MCVHLHACALVDEAQGREHTINWAAWIGHAELTRLKWVERQCEDCDADHIMSAAEGSPFFRLCPR